MTVPGGKVNRIVAMWMGLWALAVFWHGQQHQRAATVAAQLTRRAAWAMS
jgi:hypothetical protein